MSEIRRIQQQKQVPPILAADRAIKTKQKQAPPDIFGVSIKVDV
jgi:hypothetical protein